MREGQKLIDLIGDIYDLPLDFGLWVGVLAGITDFVGSRTCGFVIKDLASNRSNIIYQAGVDPHYAQLYADYGALAPLLSLPRLGEVVGIPDLVDYDDYRRNPFYQEWLRPQKRVDTAYVMVKKSATDAALLAFGPRKPNAMVDEDLRQRIALVAPHFRRALHIGEALDLKKSEAATFGDTLNALSAAMFLVDARGRIVHANAAGHDMLYANDFLYSLGGKLTIRDPLIDQTLREGCAAAGAGNTVIGGRTVALPMTARDGERYLAHVLPLTSGARKVFGMAYTAVAAVFVRKVALGSATNVIAQTYQLTPAELRVLHAIVEVGGVPETAQALGVAETTVKTHLYHLFDKTSVNRQADLVKLVAGYSNPLVE